MKAQDLHIIYFAGGCFWGVEHYFKQVRGVVETQAGYANGNRARPDYEEVCTGRTGFAETVRVTFDATQVDLDLLLQLYFKAIDPTSLNRQGGDAGSQYRTGIFLRIRKTRRRRGKLWMNWRSSMRTRSWWNCCR